MIRACQKLKKECIQEETNHTFCTGEVLVPDARRIMFRNGVIRKDSLTSTSPRNGNHFRPNFRLELRGLAVVKVFKLTS